MSGGFELVVSPTLLEELADVLERPKFLRWISSAVAREAIDGLTDDALVLDDPPALPGVSPDPDDDYLIALRASFSNGSTADEAPRRLMPPIDDPSAFQGLGRPGRRHPRHLPAAHRRKDELDRMNQELLSLPADDSLPLRRVETSVGKAAKSAMRTGHVEAQLASELAYTTRLGLTEQLQQHDHVLALQHQCSVSCFGTCNKQQASGPAGATILSTELGCPRHRERSDEGPSHGGARAHHGRSR
jgi:hypothetical protein